MSSTMSKTKSNRRSLTMPAQESAMAAMRDLKISPEAKDSTISSTSGSREQAINERSASVINTEANLRPQTPETADDLEDIHRDPNTIPPSPPFSFAATETSSKYESTAMTPPRHQHTNELQPSLFSNLKASQSVGKASEPTVRSVSPEEWNEARMKQAKSTPEFRPSRNDVKVPNIPILDLSVNVNPSIPAPRETYQIPRRPVHHVPAPINVPRSTAFHSAGPGSPLDNPHNGKRNARGFFGMKRNTSSKEDNMGSQSKPSTPVLTKAPDSSHGKPQSRDHSVGRNPSPLVETDDLLVAPQGVLKDQRSQSFRDGPGSVLFQGLSKSAGKAAAGFSKTKKWLGGQNHGQKNTGNSTVARPEPIANYVAKVLALSLSDQTRITRIAKRLEDSKDKTEFWMPALPWRCIDYLNFYGCEAEGLYRIPGSSREVNWFWQRFDLEHDINLFDQEGLYDVNIIGSLFKQWLRHLPLPILDKVLQYQVDSKYENLTRAPEELKEILSKLPPWNYYLLFAITCHLSLLNAYEEKNKMTLTNLFICFGPSLQLTQKCFFWLVGDWRSCWTGCSTESEALEDEYRVLTRNQYGEGPGPDLGEDRKSSFSSATSDRGQQTQAYPLNQRSQQKVEESRIGYGNYHKENRSAGRSKDEGHPPSSQHGHDGTPSGSTVHGRNNSHIPELNLPGKMSPLFAPDGSD